MKCGYLSPVHWTRVILGRLGSSSPWRQDQLVIPSLAQVHPRTDLHRALVPSFVRSFVDTWWSQIEAVKGEC